MVLQVSQGYTLCFIWVKHFPFQHTGMNIRRLVALLDLLAQLLLSMKIRQVSHAAVSSLSNKTFMRIYIHYCSPFSVIFLFMMLRNAITSKIYIKCCCALWNKLVYEKTKVQKASYRNQVALSTCVWQFLLHIIFALSELKQSVSKFHGNDSAVFFEMQYMFYGFIILFSI